MCVQGPTTTIQENIFNTGKLQISITDDFQRLQGFGKATSLTFTIEEISFGKEGSSLIKVLDIPKTIDIIQFSNSSPAMLVEANVGEGVYTQIRLKLSNPSIKIYNQDLAIFNKTFPLIMSTNEILVGKIFSVEKGNTTHLVIDFDVTLSVSKIAGYSIEYRFNPVIDTFVENEECDRCVKIT